MVKIIGPNDPEILYYTHASAIDIGQTNPPRGRKPKNSCG